MSELKATTAQEIVRNEKDCDYMDELFGGVKMPPTQVYLKSEADKAIADLEESHKKEVEQLLILNREQANSANRLRDDMERVIRHHKRKRCLAMAKLCRSEWAAAIFIPEKGGTDKQAALYMKWEKRWLKLAEKFKEAK